MTEIFDELAAVDDPITEEDRVVHMLASFSESYDILVMALCRHMIQKLDDAFSSSLRKKCMNNRFWSNYV